MKHHIIRLTGLLSILVLAAVTVAGTWSSNNFFYQPSIGARGSEEKHNFDAGLQRVDAHLGKHKTLGDPGYATLSEALNTIGTQTEVTLTIPAGTFPVAASTTIPANIALRILKGGKFDISDGAILTIAGYIDAGPYQIFSGPGAVTLGGVNQIYDIWFASPPDDPEGNVAAGIGSIFIKTSAGTPIFFMKASGTGTTGWATMSEGGGATQFSTLTDTPSSYSGNAGKEVSVNSSANGLTFKPKAFITLGEDGYATLPDALNAIGSTNTTLVVPTEAGAVAMSSNTAIGSNINLKVENGAYFDISDGVTLTINGPIDAGPYRIFAWTGTGKVEGLERCALIRADWWGPAGDGSTDDTDAVGAAINAAEGTNVWLEFTPGKRHAVDQIVVDQNQTLIRAYGVTFIHNGDNKALMEWRSATSQALRFFEWHGGTFVAKQSDTNPTTDVIFVKRLFHCLARDITIFCGTEGTVGQYANQTPHAAYGIRLYGKPGEGGMYYNTFDHFQIFGAKKAAIKTDGPTGKIGLHTIQTNLSEATVGNYIRGLSSGATGVISTVDDTYDYIYLNNPSTTKFIAGETLAETTDGTSGGDTGTTYTNSQNGEEILNRANGNTFISPWILGNYWGFHAYHGGATNFIGGTFEYNGPYNIVAEIGASVQLLGTHAENAQTEDVYVPPDPAMEARWTSRSVFLGSYANTPDEHTAKWFSIIRGYDEVYSGSKVKGRGEAYFEVMANAPGNWAYRAMVTGDTQVRCAIGANGRIWFSPGSGALDTSLSRVAPGIVATGSGGGIGVGNTVSNTHTPTGATARAMPIYDHTGSLLGYVPIYGSQW